MTRKISELAAAALESGRNFKQANTRVESGEMYLFDNLIATYYNGQKLRITLAGWPTLTTCERLNALSGVRITRYKGKAFLNGEEMQNFDWYTIE